ncbi:MAG TPA: vWA domain-containing protein, partial [Polyangia bacterium]
MRGKARPWKSLRLLAAAWLIGHACAPTPVDRFGPRARATGGADGDPGPPNDPSGGAGGEGGAASGMSGGAANPPSAAPMLPDAKPEMPFDGGVCGAEAVPLERVRPEMLLVLDRSESMLLTLEGLATSRWTEITGALFEMLAATNGLVHWGLKTYPTSPECSVGAPPEVEITTTIGTVAAAIANGAPTKGNGTPTAGGITAATAYLMTRMTPNPKYIVLATDGEPTCTIARGPGRSIEAATAARAAGFPVYVVGIATANTKADTTLNAIAEAGGVPRAGDLKYYPVASRRDLLAVFADITQQVTTCTFPLTKDPPAPNNMFVIVEGGRLPRDPSRANGWDYDPA